MNNIYYYVAFKPDSFDKFSREIINILRNGDDTIVFDPFAYCPVDTLHKDVIYVLAEKEILEMIPKGSLVIMVNTFVESDEHRIFHYVTDDHQKSLPAWLSSIVSNDIKRLITSIRKNYEEQKKIAIQIDQLNAKMEMLGKKFAKNYYFLFF